MSSCCHVVDSVLSIFFASWGSVLLLLYNLYFFFLNSLFNYGFLRLFLRLSKRTSKLKTVRLEAIVAMVLE